MTYVDLSQMVEEVFFDFLQSYPTELKLPKEILEWTQKRVMHSLRGRSKDSLESYVIGLQLRVDITVELTKAAMLMKERPATTDLIVMKPTNSFSYDKQGKVVFLPLKPSRIY